jgi:hypothetical protein
MRRVEKAIAKDLFSCGTLSSTEMFMAAVEANKNKPAKAKATNQVIMSFLYIHTMMISVT